MTRSQIRAVEVVDPDPEWANRFSTESDRLAAILGTGLVRIEHIGSTAIPGIKAKPIVDLMPLVVSIDSVDGLEAEFEKAGYNWYHEYGLPGRRYLNRDNLAAGKRIANVHIYQADHPEVARHLAFRDYLRANPNLAAEYEAVKVQCAARCAQDVDAYNECKDPWIKPVELAAVTWFAGRDGAG
jgi:GrpB-like predicted nucleotidyltransferase (UPF0157 family)